MPLANRIHCVPSMCTVRYTHRDYMFSTIWIIARFVWITNKTLFTLVIFLRCFCLCVWFFICFRFHRHFVVFVVVVCFFILVTMEYFEMLASNNCAFSNLNRHMYKNVLVYICSRLESWLLLLLLLLGSVDVPKYVALVFFSSDGFQSHPCIAHINMWCAQVHMRPIEPIAAIPRCQFYSIWNLYLDFSAIFDDVWCNNQSTNTTQIVDCHS